MNAELVKTVRRERSLVELQRLGCAIENWIVDTRKIDLDRLGHHKTQLEALETVLIPASNKIAEDLANMPLTGSVGEVFDRCREFDEATVWLDRMWEFYRTKFDQRGDEQLGGLLRAADEIVWSCYHEIMSRASGASSVDHGASPLPFVATEYSPAALESTSPLRGALALRVEFETWDDDLEELVRSLPLSLLLLPPWCVNAPWWLIYAAHEVGHHLLAELNLLQHFGEGIEHAVDGVDGMSASMIKRWRQWTEEIFADAVSVMLMGSWAIWSVVEVEWGSPQAMVRPTKSYPAPLVRIELMRHLAERLGFDTKDALRGIDLPQIAADHPALQPDLAAVKPVVELMLEALPHNLGTLATLCKVDPGRFEKSVRGWSKILLQAHIPASPPALETARYITAGALARWAKITGEAASAEDRAKRVKALASSTLEALQRSGPPGTRGEKLPSGKRPEIGIDLAQKLTQAIARRRAAAEG